MQALEYSLSPFSIRDGVYGAIFFILTGFHGFHVIIGTLYLSYVLIQIILGKLLRIHHFSFERAR